MRLTPVIITLSFALVACGSSKGNERAQRDDTTRDEPAAATGPAPGDPVVANAPVPEPEPPPPTPLRDAEILKVADTVDSGEIELATMVKGKLKAKGAKDFAAMMVKHHTASKKKGAALAKKLGLEPADNEVSTKLTGDVAAVKAELEGKTGPELDQAYIESQVKMHEDVLALIDTRLMADATAPELKAQLEATKKTVQSHIEAAERVRSDLANK